MYTDFEYCLVFCPEYHSTSRINFTVNVSLVILLPLFSGVFGPHFWPMHLAVITHLKLITYLRWCLSVSCRWTIVLTHVSVTPTLVDLLGPVGSGRFSTSKSSLLRHPSFASQTGISPLWWRWTRLILGLE